MSATLLSAATPLRTPLLAAACLFVLTLTCAADTTVSVVVRGPWAYEMIPQSGPTPGQLILIAPQDSLGHHSPSILHKDGELPISIGKNILNSLSFDYAAGTAPSTTVPASCDPKKVANGYHYSGFTQDALNTLIKSGNAYILSLPMPDGCAPAQEYESDVRTHWSDPEKHATYATDMVFTYAGPTKFRFGSGVYDFEGGNILDLWMQPKGTLPPFCDMDSRHAFHMLTKTLGLGSQLFEDFPGRRYRDPLCLLLDEQHPNYTNVLNKHVGDFAYKLILVQDTTNRLKQAQILVSFVFLAKEMKNAGVSDNSPEFLPMRDLLKRYDGQSIKMLLAKPKNQLQESFETVVHIFLDGAGSCRKAIIQLTPN
jgi:hypothetical protein